MEIDSFIDGNSMTFLAAIATLAVLCFFGTNHENGENNNFIQKLLLSISQRTLGFIVRESGSNVAIEMKEDYTIISKAIANSNNDTNPYKQKMMEIADNLQFQTVDYQNRILTIRKEIESFHRKITSKDLVEFLSSPFYAFIFSVFVMSVSCIFGKSQRYIDIVSITSIISFLYLIIIWCYYWRSIKNRTSHSKDNIAYQFNKTACIRNFFLICIMYGLVCYFSMSLGIIWLAKYGWFPIFFVYLLYLLLKFRNSKHNHSIFTRYFTLIHFVFIILFSLIVCIIQHIIGVVSVFNNNVVQTLSLLFALSSFIIFPLAIPMVRFYIEVNRAIKAYNESTNSYIQDSKKYRKQLENYFQVLYKLHVLHSPNTGTPPTNDMKKNDGDIINNKESHKSIKSMLYKIFFK